MKLKCLRATLDRHLGRSVLTVLVTFACALFFFWSEQVHAASTTIKFEATVGPPNTVSPYDVPFDLPLSFKEGDTLFGRVTFDPLHAFPTHGGTNSVQIHNVTLWIGPDEVGTSKYELRVSNDVFADDGPEGGYDEIRLGCSPFVGGTETCAPNYLSSRDDVLWGFHIALWGDTNVLADGHIPTNIAQWNAMNERSLWMSFREATGSGIIRLSASINEFQLIPEPGAVVLMLVGLAVVLNCRVLRRRS